MSNAQNEAAFLGAVVLTCGYRSVEQRMSGYAFSTAQFREVWTGIGMATKFGAFKSCGDGVLAVAAYVRQKHYTADALRRCLEAFEACPVGTTVDALADRLLAGEDAA